MGIIKAICISAEKGTPKQTVDSARLRVNWGIEGDAHAGEWHRQVSLLSQDKVDAFNSKGAQVIPGAFGENLVVEGIDLSALPVGALLRSGQALLKVTQIGKECHSHCEIHQRVGDCIMPREGVFATVEEGGTLRTGDPIGRVLPYRAACLTLSDRGSRGEKEDRSGPLVRELLEQAGYTVAEHAILPDERPLIEQELRNLTDRKQVDLILTTGGTGFSPRDITPEATLAVAHRQAPGIAEAARAHSMTITSRAMLSRGVSVIRGRTLIINLPGSPKAVRETLEYLLPQLEHGLKMLQGNVEDCAQSSEKR